VSSAEFAAAFCFRSMLITVSLRMNIMVNER